MAWVEGKTWTIEQGAPLPMIFTCWANEAKTQAFNLTGWDVNATIYDERGRLSYPCSVSILNNTVTISITDQLSEDLKVGKSYLYDAIAVPPANGQKEFLAQGPVEVKLRKSRRDP